MPVPVVTALAASDESRAIDTIVLAFAADPVLRWIWPDAQRYLAGVAAFKRAFAGPAFANDGAFATADCAGVALWLRPGVQSDGAAMNEVIARTASPTALVDLVGFGGQLAQYHPHEPHWYLPTIGVDPSRQGQGHGAALMKHVLREIDRDHVPAYLESSNPKNITLYQRHGFEIVGTIQAGGSPPLVPMLRRAR